MDKPKKRIEKANGKRKLKAARYVELKNEPQTLLPEARETSEPDFEESLNLLFDYSPENTRKKKIKIDKWDLIRYPVLFVCVFVFLFAGYQLIIKLFDYAEGEKIYSEIADLFYEVGSLSEDYLEKSRPNIPSLTALAAFDGAEPSDLEQEKILSSTQQLIAAKLEKLRQINGDIYGWIKINGTTIDYPIVQARDNDYYLRRDFYGKYLNAGSIFVDYQNGKLLSQNYNTVIYGHNMNDGSMFNNLHDLKNESVFNNTLIEITTEEGIFVYRPFSIHVPTETFNYFQIEFESQQEFYDFILDMQRLSMFQTDIKLKPEDKIITLSTCIDTILQSEYRLAVHAVLVEVRN